MARCAIGLPLVSRVVENDIETFQSGKPLHRSGFRIRMTNRADGVFIIGKLRRVTARARHMPDKLRRRRIIFSLMTKSAGKTRVFGIGMLEIRKIRIWINHRRDRGLRRVRRH